MKPKLFRMFAFIIVLTLIVTPVSAKPQLIVTDNQQNSQTLSTSNPLEKVDPVVLFEVNSQGVTDFFIWMAEQADVSAAQQLSTKLEKGEYVFETLRSFADQSQKELRSCA